MTGGGDVWVDDEGEIERLCSNAEANSIVVGDALTEVGEPAGGSLAGTGDTAAPDGGWRPASIVIACRSEARWSDVKHFPNDAC